MAAPSEAQNPTRPAPRPQGFDQSAWITLTVGYAQKAEPRWLIPMICKAGGITKRDIGTIRIEDRVTHVELNAAVVEAFFTHLDADGRIEKNIVAMPMREQEQMRPERDERPQRQERSERQDRPQRSERTERQDRPQRAERQERPVERQERAAPSRPGRKEREQRRGKPPVGKQGAGKHAAGKPAGGKPHKKKKWNPAD